ncbi:winged helix-turn-helix domain-containing protein, partial [Candidatus Venteria ishoeyi]|uniref:winged helix-turn-helix domain-containing protein n=1 Tax=Candidatus Venteria ishoeyi TaxID=1899563 RepID=UPI0025A5021A
SKERVLIYLSARKQGYAREIAQFFNTSVTPIQRQLDLLEEYGILYSETQGRTILYALNPRYPLHKELRLLMTKALQFYPAEEQEKLTMERRRPRRKNKPLSL